MFPTQFMRSENTILCFLICRLLFGETTGDRTAKCSWVLLKSNWTTLTCPAWQLAGTNCLQTLLSSVHACPRPPEPSDSEEPRFPAARFWMTWTLRHNTSCWMLFTFCVMPFPVRASWSGGSNTFAAHNVERFFESLLPFVFALWCWYFKMIYHLLCSKFFKRCITSKLLLSSNS